MATQSSETTEVQKKEDVFKVTKNAQTSENEHKKAFEEWAEAMKQKNWARNSTVSWSRKSGVGRQPLD